MGHSPSPSAMADARGVLDAALDAPKGIKVEFASHGAAMRLRQRCYAVRERERAFSRKTRSKDDTLFGASPWDVLMFFLREEDGKHYLFITHDPESAAQQAYKIQEL